MAQNYMFFLKVPLFKRGYFQKMIYFSEEHPLFKGLIRL